MLANRTKTSRFLPVCVGTLLLCGFFQVLAAAPDPILLDDINPFPSIGSSPIFLTPLGNQMLFIADDGSIGAELWRADSAGASLVKDIAPGADPLIPYNLKMYTIPSPLCQEKPETLGKGDEEIIANP